MELKPHFASNLFAKFNAWQIIHKSSFKNVKSAGFSVRNAVVMQLHVFMYDTESVTVC